MGVLNQIKDMKKEGMEENQISQKLQEQGIPPKDITDAFGQEKIRDAVSAKPAEEYGEMPHAPIEQQKNSFYAPKTQDLDGHSEEYSSQAPSYPPQSQEETYAPQEEYYPEQGGYAESGGYSTDTIIEIAEQVFSEKIRKIEKKIDSLSEFATLAQTKITNNNERIKRVESVMDKLQIAILEKIGSYGKDVGGIKKEMEMMQESFSKVLPELAKKHHAHKK